MRLFDLSWLFLLWLNPNASLQQNEIKCQLTLPPLRGTTYEPAYRSLFSPGEKIRVTCGEGYWILNTQTTSTETTCKNDGDWTIRPVCEEVTCSHPQALYLDHWGDSGQQQRLGDTVTYRCGSDYRSTDGAAWATCTRDGWKPNPLCQEKCGVPETPAGLTITTDVTDDQIRKGQHLTFACEDSNHIIKGNATLECLENGRWSNPLPTCEAAKDCRRPPPPLSHGRTKTVTRYPYRHNDKVEYVCDTDYGMEGGPFKTCVDGDWVGEMRCRPAQGCGKPPHLSDGDTKTSTKYQYQHNERVEYICQPYYVMEGGPFKTCKDGEWTGEIRCLRPCTVNRDDMNRHNIQFRYSRDDKLYSEHNDLIEFACTRGHRHVGAVGMRPKCEHGVIHLPTCQ
ncbi:complement factor H-related protein 3-like [Oreochromis aureus]|uniref:complement factor H-related protein 3-like n=1 Tax=Oreochromis aureus TaxID=47969 RepID=UPI001954E370|nr:complement factor H-related protein 3-like [Oreochromis aureus]